MKLSFPERKWHPTANGWVDRPVTEEDQDIRRKVEACLMGDKDVCDEIRPFIKLSNVVSLQSLVNEFRSDPDMAERIDRYKNAMFGEWPQVG